MAEEQSTPPNVFSVTAEQVAAAMDRCTFAVVHRPNDTTSTFVHAFIDGTFYLASGHSACVDPANYSAELGEKYARERCEYALRNKLWELLGYQLYDNLRASRLASQEEPPVPGPSESVAFDAAGMCYPLYRSSKLVRAFRIGSVSASRDGFVILPANQHELAYFTDLAFIDRHKPKPGGYVVFYPDGYVSYSPAEPFEASTRRIGA